MHVIIFVHNLATLEGGKEDRGGLRQTGCNVGTVNSLLVEYPANYSPELACYLTTRTGK
jgi:hypothetical protein